MEQFLPTSVKDLTLPLPLLDCFECFYYSQSLRLLQEMRVWKSSYTQTSTPVTFFFSHKTYFFHQLDLVVLAAAGCFLRTKVG